MLAVPLLVVRFRVPRFAKVPLPLPSVTSDWMSMAAAASFSSTPLPPSVREFVPVTVMMPALSSVEFPMAAAP